MHQKCVWWPAPPGPAWGACSAPPDPLDELKGRLRGEERGEEVGNGRGKEGKGRRKRKDPNV